MIKSSLGCRICGEPAVIFATDNNWSWPIDSEGGIRWVEATMLRPILSMSACFYCRTHGLKKQGK